MKVKGSVFIVAVVGSSAMAYEVRICAGCA